MFDPLLKQLAAKAKAVGLIAGTAMVTTALVGGGAVALTTVSHDGDLVEDAVVVAEASPSPSAESESDSPLLLADVVAAATPTVGIEEPDEDGDVKVRPPLPADFTCDDTKNHGQNVSAYAKSLPKGPGRGEKVSAVAQSDCGKTAGEGTEEVATAEVEEADEVEAEEIEEPKPAKADKPAKAQKPMKAGKSGGKGKGGGKK